MARNARARSRRRPNAAVRTLLITDALTSWVVPTVTMSVLALAALLSTLALVPAAPAAAAFVLAALALGAFTIVAPYLDPEAAPRPLTIPALVAGAVLWIAVLYLPFHWRIFPAAELTRTPVSPAAAGTVLGLAGRGTRFDVTVDAHLPPSAEQRDRSTHYDLDLADASGRHVTVAGELGDRWRTRRLGRRGTAPAHFEHLSTMYVVDDPDAGDLRLVDVHVSGDPGITLTATVYPHRGPGPTVLYAGAALLTVAALAFDLWTGRVGTPMSALVTAVAAGAALAFSASGAGHPGVREVIGAAIVGTMIGVPAAAIAGWAAPRVVPAARR